MPFQFTESTWSSAGLLESAVTTGTIPNWSGDPETGYLFLEQFDRYFARYRVNVVNAIPRASHIVRSRFQLRLQISGQHPDSGGAGWEFDAHRFQDLETGSSSSPTSYASASHTHPSGSGAWEQLFNLIHSNRDWLDSLVAGTNTTQVRFGIRFYPLISAITGAWVFLRLLPRRHTESSGSWSVWWYNKPTTPNITGLLSGGNLWTPFANGTLTFSVAQNLGNTDKTWLQVFLADDDQETATPQVEIPGVVNITNATTRAGTVTFRFGDGLNVNTSYKARLRVLVDHDKPTVDDITPVNTNIYSDNTPNFIFRGPVLDNRGARMRGGKWVHTNGVVQPYFESNSARVIL